MTYFGFQMNSIVSRFTICSYSLRFHRKRPQVVRTIFRKQLSLLSIFTGILLHNYSIKLCVLQEQKFGFKRPYTLLLFLVNTITNTPCHISVKCAAIVCMAEYVPCIKWLKIRSTANNTPNVYS